MQQCRERYLQRFTGPAEMASRSARAWAWALGESDTAPVTDRRTAVPPSRSDIEAEIAAADERRLRGDRENRADAAATVLRWLIGADDRVPVRGENTGELVDGFGDVVRSRKQIADVLALTLPSQQRSVADSQDLTADADRRRLAQHDADYLDGVAATLALVLGKRGESPITRVHSRGPTTKDLKKERIHAEDVIEQARQPCMNDHLLSPSYGEGVKLTIIWLIGDSTMSPLDTGVRQFCR